MATNVMVDIQRFCLILACWAWATSADLVGLLFSLYHQSLMGGLGLLGGIFGLNATIIRSADQMGESHGFVIGCIFIFCVSIRLVVEAHADHSLKRRCVNHSSW